MRATLLSPPVLNVPCIVFIVHWEKNNYTQLIIIDIHGRTEAGQVPPCLAFQNLPEKVKIRKKGQKREMKILTLPPQRKTLPVQVCFPHGVECGCIGPPLDCQDIQLKVTQITIFLTLWPKNDSVALWQW